MTESNRPRPTPADPSAPRRGRASRRRTRHARYGQVTVRTITRPGPDGRPVRLILYGYTIGSGKHRRHRERQEWTETDAQLALNDEREARARVISSARRSGRSSR